MDAAVRIDWATEVGALAAVEPTREELVTHAAALAIGYNEPANAALMGHGEPMSADDVIAHYEDMAEEHARQFLLFLDGKLVGDADLRGARDRAAEFAFMIGARDQQGKGLGTRFAIMIHAFAFATAANGMALDRVYASIVPHNTASRRVFDKLGYTLDDSAAARDFADEPGDVVMSIDRATFARANAAALAAVKVGPR